jgi:hypothetical protein
VRTIAAAYTMGNNVNDLLHIMILDKSMAHFAFKIIDRAVPH